MKTILHNSDLSSQLESIMRSFVKEKNRVHDEGRT